MIISKALDVEVFPNLFSIGFVDIRDYFRVFADCVDDKGNPIPLTDKLTVAEIKERLNKVDKRKFYISDTNDSQLLELVSYINNMQAHYETDSNGNQIPIRYDCYGYNIQGYDDYIIKAFMMQFNRFDHVKNLLEYLYNLSKKIIDAQKDREAFKNDKQLDLIRRYRLPYATVDVQKIYALNAVTVAINKETGERQKFGKRLKQVSINLKWYNLLEFVLPPIDEEEADKYWRKFPSYGGMSTEQLNMLITKDFDRYILPKYVEHMLDYNFNDIYLVAEIVRQKPDEVKLRYSLGTAFKLNFLCSSRANIADKLLEKFYSEMSGLRKEQFENLRTERTKLSFNKVIFPHIRFQTKELQELLSDMKTIVTYRTNKESFSRVVKFKGSTYTFAMGGIHSQDVSSVFTSSDKYTYIHYDISSFYPSVMVAYKICPKHLNQKVFTKMVDYFRTTRIKCKHTKDEVEQCIKGVHNKLSAEALKIVINAIYGKFGSDKFWLYDRFAQLQVTINGQLMVMMVIEALELNGIHVVSANTDGIIVKLPNDKRYVFKQITDEWCKQNQLGADSEEYDKFVARDINNYLDKQKDGCIEYKGSLDPKQYIKDLKKGYDMPIVAKAVENYFLNGKPVMETLRDSTDIFDFCKTQAVGEQFEFVYFKNENGKVDKVYGQHNNRFYVANKGVILQKEHTVTKKRSNLAGGLPVVILNTLDDVPIENRDINYRYYYDEAYKIIDPIMLNISPNQKANMLHKTVSGKILIKKYAHDYQNLFNNDDFD